MNAADFLAMKALEYAANFKNKATKLKSDLEKIKRRERLIELELDAARSAIYASMPSMAVSGRCWIHHKTTTLLTPVPRPIDIFVCDVCKAGVCHSFRGISSTHRRSFHQLGRSVVAHEPLAAPRRLPNRCCDVNGFVETRSHAPASR